MSKAIKIKANPPAGIPFVGAAHRLWMPGETLVELLTTEDDPPEVDVEIIEQGSTKVLRVEKRPNPACIGQRSYREILNNPRLSILSDADSVGAQAMVEVNAAKEVVAKLSGELTDEKVAHAKTKEELESLKLQVGPIAQERDALAKLVADLQAAAGKSDPEAKSNGKDKPAKS